METLIVMVSFSILSVISIFVTYKNAKDRDNNP